LGQREERGLAGGGGKGALESCEGGEGPGGLVVVALGCRSASVQVHGSNYARGESGGVGEQTSDLVWLGGM
jgi:hypothetical protein